MTKLNLQSITDLLGEPVIPDSCTDDRETAERDFGHKYPARAELLKELSRVSMESGIEEVKRWLKALNSVDTTLLPNRQTNPFMR